MEAPISHESRASTLYAVMGVFFPIAFTAVSLRLYSRIKYSYIGIDDVLIILALVCLSWFRLPSPGTHMWNCGREC